MFGAKFVCELKTLVEPVSGCAVWMVATIYMYLVSWRRGVA